MSNLDSNVDAYKKEFAYDFDNEIMLNYYPSRIIEKMNPGSFLELGLGHGYTIREFLKKISEYTILEGSSAVIENFKITEPELFNKVQVLEVFFEDFVTQKKYDNIIMGFILEHVDNPDEILLKYKNYLSKNGKIFIAVPNADSLHRQIGYYAGHLNKLDALSESDLLLGHRRYYNKKMLVELVHRNGFKVISTEGIFLKPLMTSQLASLDLPKEIVSGMLEVGKNYPELSNAILIEIEHG